MKRLKIIFAWFDIWVGLYWDRTKRHLYIFPVPMIGLRIDLKPKDFCEHCGGKCERLNVTWPGDEPE